MRPLRVIALALLGLGIAREASAHDFWIEASTWTPRAGALVLLTLRVGEYFRGETFARRASHAAQFFALGPRGVLPVSGAEGDDPAGLVVVDAAGVTAVAYASHGSRLELPAARFESYLLEEGLEHVIRQRAERGESGEPGRELFVRCAKALLATTAPGPSDAAFRAVGLPAELVIAEDPRSLRPGGRVRIQALLRDLPASGVQVLATPHGDPETCLRERTDELGHATFTLERPGPWLLRGVIMERAPPGLGVDWVSHWPSLSFEVSREP